jgi:hypothetical protein
MLLDFAQKLFVERSRDENSGVRSHPSASLGVHSASLRVHSASLGVHTSASLGVHSASLGVHSAPLGVYNSASLGLQNGRNISRQSSKTRPRVEVLDFYHPKKYAQKDYM